MTTAVQRHRRHVKSILLKRNGYQFGQPPATCSLVTQSYPGDVACADTAIQMTARIIKGQYYSLNYIRRISRWRYRVPLAIPHVVVALRALGLSYEIRTDLTAGQLMRIARERGPVLVAEDYWSHPQWKGYLYAGRRQNGWARNRAGRRIYVGFAKPLERAGSTQWTFRDGHMVLLASSFVRNGKQVAIVRDSNHNSASRPERPAWDEVTSEQLNRMLRSFNYGRIKIAIIPTRKLWRD